MEPAWVPNVDLAEAAFEGLGIDLEARDVLVEQLPEPGAHVGNAEDGVVHELMQQDPQPQVLVGEAPLVAEGVDVRGDDEQLVGQRPG